jgi:hypothetical protein
MRAHTSGRVTSFVTMREMQCVGVRSYILQVRCERCSAYHPRVRHIHVKTKRIFWNKIEFKYIFFKFNNIVHIILLQHRLQMSYLVQFGVFVGKNILATRTVAPLVVVVIHKHKSIAIRNKSPRLP